MSSGGKRSSSSKRITIGHKYFIGIHMVLCHGPIDRIERIRVSETNVWTNNISSNSRININKPNAFGGEKQEGGIQGGVDIAFGGTGQGVNDYLNSRISGNVPAYRGIVSVILRRVYVAAMNPYIKPWKFLCARYGGAAIGNDMNPVRIIQECLTNNEWGMGYPMADLGTSITSTAIGSPFQTLLSENFGLSLLWDTSISIQDFLNDILQHIEGFLYVDIFTGKFELSLLRDDYDTETLPIINENIIKEVQSFSRRSKAELINTVIIKYKEGASDQNKSITLHNIGLLQQQGGQIISEELDFPGIATGALANKVAARELVKLGSELSTAIFTGDRSLMNYKLGDVFKFSFAPYGINQEIMRVSYIDYGGLQEGLITIHATEDVFGVGEAVYEDPPPSQWVEPIAEPMPSPERIVQEAPYWDLVQNFGESETIWNEIDDLIGFIQVLARKPLSFCFNYRLFTGTSSGNRVDQGVNDFTPTALLTEDIPKGVSNISVGFTSNDDVELVEVGTYCFINNEYFGVTSINLETNTVTLMRAILDSVPQSHSVGDRIWFVENLFGTDEIEYYSGETIRAWVCPTTPMGELPVAQAPMDSYTFNSRMIRPYLPGRLQINLNYYPDYITGELGVTWRHRDRKQQTVDFVSFISTSNIGPEVGTTYRIRVYDDEDNLLTTIDGLTGNEWTYNMGQEMIDYGKTHPCEKMRIEIESLRDGYVSWQKHEHEFECKGYGLFYGEYYGE